MPDRLLAGAARTLRCSRCGTDFALPQAARAAEAVPPAPPPAPEPPVAAAPAPAAEPAADSAAPRAERTPVASTPPNDAALQRAWVASLLVVVGGVLGLLVFRSQVMAAWPPATRLFAVLGLA